MKVEVGPLGRGADGLEKLSRPVAAHTPRPPRRLSSHSTRFRIYSRLHLASDCSSSGGSRLRSERLDPSLRFPALQLPTPALAGHDPKSSHWSLREDISEIQDLLPFVLHWTMNPQRDESFAPPMTPAPSAPVSPWESADAMAVHSPEPGILVVDDSEWSRDLILRFLKGLRVPVESATSAEEALTKARANPPAVIISDWMMPGMDGLELCRAIRADRGLSTTHFLILTARSEQEDVVEAFRAGADDFLTKPVNDNELRARIRVGLRLHTLYRAVDAHRLQLSQAHDRLDEQIKEIKTLQADFLPHQFPILGGLAFTAFCRPCIEVGGDYYDVFTLPDGRVCITMADVTGHGARAAVCMAMTRSLTRAAASQMTRNHDPAWMLQRLNSWLCDQLADSQFVTMWLGLWDPQTGRLQYSRAGHPSGILWPAEKDPILLEDPGVPPLGLFSYIQPPPVESLEIPPGCRFVLYTDGWSESFDPNGQIYDDAGFLASLKSAAGLSLEQIPEVLLRRLQEFVQGEPLDDDISLLIFERCNPSAAGADA